MDGLFRLFRISLSASFILSSLCVSFSSAYANNRYLPVGAGQIALDPIVGQKGPSDNNNNPAVPATTSDFSQAPSTNQWWSSLIWKFNGNPGSENLFPYPLSLQAAKEGLKLGYSTESNVNPYGTTGLGVKVHEYHYSYQPELTVGIRDMNSQDVRVEKYSDWTVTSVWTGNGKTLKATVGEGLPFAYFTATGGDVEIQLGNAANIWSQNGPVVGLTVNGHHYGVFAPSGSSWAGRYSLQSNLNGKDYFSVAVLPDNKPETLEYFRQHAYAFVTDTKVSWSYDEATAKMTSRYSFSTALKESGENNSNVNTPLVALFRHQWLNSAAPLTQWTYVSARGLMKVGALSEFTTSLTFNGVLPEIPRTATDGIDTYSSAKQYQYVDEIYRQTPLERWNKDAADTYWSGKAMGKITRLIYIADQLKHTAARDLFLSELKAHLENWFKAKDPQVFYYDKTWTTLIGYPSSYGSDTLMNDHHFHWGYFVQAAAAIAQFDSSWAAQSQFGGMVEMLIKDSANSDRTDQRFPFLRNYDTYAGHSWANGPALFAAGNNLESSSESMNFSAALILWGANTGNRAIRDLGIYLYTTETAAIEQYWFDIDRQVFPADFPEPTVGMVWGNGGAYAIWFSGYVQQLHGINFLPVTGGSFYLGRNPDYLKTNQDFMIRSQGSNLDGWRDIHLSVKAFYDPRAAIDEYNQNQNYPVEDGESRAHTYHWIHSLNALGRLETQVTGDVPTAAVFSKNGVRHYTAYNPATTPIQVHFSDGAHLNVPAKATTTSLGGKRESKGQRHKRSHVRQDRQARQEQGQVGHGKRG